MLGWIDHWAVYCWHINSHALALNLNIRANVYNNSKNNQNFYSPGAKWRNVIASALNIMINHSAGNSVHNIQSQMYAHYQSNYSRAMQFR